MGRHRLHDERLPERLGETPIGALVLRALAGEERVHAVGGAVRDLLLGREPTDVDLVVEGYAIGLARRAARRIGGEVRVHERFGTATVQAAGLSFDLATARRERYPQPGALPEVQLTVSLEEDLPRRDFTVNAIAMALGDGHLTQYPGALADLSDGVLRVLHERSFIDDPTRLARLARYAGRLGFAIEPQTAALARAAIGAGALDTLSPNRLGAELALLVAEPDPAAALAVARDIGLDAALLGPADSDRVRRALELAPADIRRPPLVLAAAWLDHGHTRLAARLRELCLPAAQRNAAAQIAAAAPGLANELSRLQAAGARPSEVLAAIGDAPPEAVALAGALGPERLASRWLNEWRNVRLSIAGADLIAAGAEPGPALRVALRAALDAKLDGSAEGRDEELAVALATLGAA